ncbi:FAD-dependent oxidoreductase [Klenkia sp. PcliD-1-E]|uniref:FAD-dependent oxidoreductase n=1 Tax=Klenkia sp. PcliD-1-E TaxID=2954492 RepID=UPI00209834EA|nr:FAD-dependent oxidoreductase [Klenkia sp. PcliD-1-E]MCO7219437.1 FAD-dependent oxidoreductase [Klenkia sp. PcliD-1-E]
MAFAITQNCCSDASCVSVCPVNCIHPTPDEPDFGRTETLYVDPATCIDCGACADACPVDAIAPTWLLRPDQQVFAQVNADWFTRPDAPAAPLWDAPRFPTVDLSAIGRLEVAIVGTGPAAVYAAQSTLRATEARVTFLERLATPGGLARWGVAPDHPGTRRVLAHTDAVLHHPRVTLRTGVEVGRDVTPAELSRRYDAVLYATGAAGDRALDVPGDDLPGSVSAREVVHWYTGHPEAVPVDLSRVRRVVVVGTGNVALDVARMLSSDPDRLAGTATSPAALAALRTSGLREVLVVGRRGPGEAACSSSELRALTHLPGVRTVLSGTAPDDAPPGSKAELFAALDRYDDDLAGPPAAGRRIVFAFGRSTRALVGQDRVRGVVLGSSGGDVTVPAELVVRAIGHRGTQLPGLPFDAESGRVPHEAGRVVGAPAGTYVVGWAKRGPSGGIGANRPDAEETVGSLLADAAAGVIGRPSRRR